MTFPAHLHSLADRFSKLGRPLRIFVALIVAAVAVIPAFFLFWYLTLYLLARSYVDELAQVFDLNNNVASAIVWATFAVTVIFVGYAVSFSRRKRLAGLAGILILLIGHSLVLAHGRVNRPFDSKGNPTKCYIVTRDSIQLGEHPGVDPVTGRACRPVTPEIAERVEAYKNGKRPTKILAREPTFFEPRTGQPIVWYYVGKDDEVQLFDLMGFHPETGEELLPVTKEIVDLWKIHLARRMPQQILDPDKFGPFDPLSGSARLWVRLADNGQYEFYDAPGYHPQTGERLQIITREVLAAWQKSRKKRWYVITRDAKQPVRYCEAEGIDEVTGRECREITPQVLERLREYEKGKRPTKITDSNPIFFEPQSGEPIVWYYKNKNGAIEIFDLMGYHPTTGEELFPITKEVASEWDEQQRKVPPRVPNPVPLGAGAFDPLTGAPLMWFSRKAGGEYEFFDGPGFNPRNGDVLKAFTKDELKIYEQELQAKEKKERDEQARRQRQKEERDAEDERKRRELEARQREEQQKREEESRRFTEAAKRCDELAANPNDPRGIGVGVEFPALKAQAAEAIEACKIAVEQNRGELRFKYQLARALEWVDRRRALRLHQELTGSGYPAAYDNLGSLYWQDLHDPERAVSMFRKGVKAGDPDAMVSLAEMIDRGHVFPTNPSETKVELYRRAAQLGHRGAAEAYRNEVTREERGHQERLMQLQQQQRVMQIFGGILQNIPRR
jgi:TPR repeat protein